MPIRGSPTAAVSPVHRVVAIARHAWSRSIGTPGRIGIAGRDHRVRAGFAGEYLHSGRSSPLASTLPIFAAGSESIIVQWVQSIQWILISPSTKDLQVSIGRLASPFAATKSKTSP